MESIANTGLGLWNHFDIHHIHTCLDIGCLLLWHWFSVFKNVRKYFYSQRSTPFTAGTMLLLNTMEWIWFFFYFKAYPNCYPPLKRRLAFVVLPEHTEFQIHAMVKYNRGILITQNFRKLIFDRAQWKYL